MATGAQPRHAIQTLKQGRHPLMSLR
jgi:hypothetical protein